MKGKHALVNEQNQRLVFDIRKFSIHDGPGIRMTIFMKGCPLHCSWCHNPEGISSHPEKYYDKAKCIGCLDCLDICAKHATSMTSKGIVTDDELCVLCGECADVCPPMATEMSAKYYSVAQIMDLVVREKPFLQQSGGGITVSGGEPLIEPEFTFDLLDACGKTGIHRAVDTSGFVKKEVIMEAAERAELFLYDLKMMDSALHRRWTGVPNEMILSNLRLIATLNVDLNIRIPVIGGVNATVENAVASAVFIAGLEKKPLSIQLLPYHIAGSAKYEKLGRLIPDHGFQVPEVNDLELIKEVFESYGLPVMVGH
ncbi:MAG TPA: glycyl-radical enzyme activating protein [Saprospirales bacterium]|nr:glycyl-radical enzyme activating protein [Saprospirales bacterium]HAY70674.1 glycyl-radical enzyme activating protein [Saprospirales bacterium]HRQ28818.1 glycyl-radical enzyme activating protein [Saprospiraceae bacterium]